MGWLNDALSTILAAVESVDPVLRTILAGLAVMLETSVLVGLVVPGDTVVIVAATGLADVPQGLFLGLSVIVGALAGESIGYGLGRWIGPHIRHSWIGRRIGERNWIRSEQYLRRRGGPAIFLSRFLPVLHSLVPLTVGMSGYSYRRFIAWTLPACTLWAAIYISIASAAADSYRELSDRAHWAGYVFVGVIVGFVVLMWLVKHILQRVERRHMDGDEAGAHGADGDATEGVKD